MNEFEEERLRREALFAPHRELGARKWTWQAKSSDRPPVDSKLVASSAPCRRTNCHGATRAYKSTLPLRALHTLARRDTRAGSGPTASSSVRTMSATVQRIASWLCQERVVAGKGRTRRTVLRGTSRLSPARPCPLAPGRKTHRSTLGDWISALLSVEEIWWQGLGRHRRAHPTARGFVRGGRRGLPPGSRQSTRRKMRW